MNIKDKIFIFPFFVVFFINLTVLVFFATYLASGQFQWTKVLYLFIILLMTIMIYYLRIITIGNNTVLDKFTTDQYFGRGLVGFVSLVLSTLITTFLIIKTKWNIFINDFQKLDFEPLKWFEFLNHNYQQIVSYTSLVVIISVILMVPVMIFSRHLSKESKEGLIKVLAMTGMMIIFLLFTSENFLNFWRSIFEIKIIRLALTYLFSGSLIYFNLFFLLKKPSA